MGLFNFNKTATLTAENSIANVNKELPTEEWIWVEGYKGTNKDMKCLDFQYELNKQFDMPEDAEIKTCSSGFHFCLYLADTFDFYNIGDGNRFFKVKALVRKTDYINYVSLGSHTIAMSVYYHDDYNVAPGYYRKLAAKSIILTEEVSMNRILINTLAGKLPDKYKIIAIKINIRTAVNQYNIDILIEDGYSAAFANYIINNGMFEAAHAAGTQQDLSMDMKVLTILFRGN
jgi:hypothetical protein